MSKSETKTGFSDDVILIVSDLHMGSGLDARRGTWSPTEDFFWDEEFADFLRHYGGKGKARLIINGDMVDFLQVLTLPTEDEQRAYAIPKRDISPRYGLRCSEAAAAFQMDKIVDGHPVAFQALADFLGRGNRVTIIKGNHDVQFFWEKTQETLRQRLELLGGSKKAGAIRANLEFLPWFFYIPGSLYVEHGNQYEPATSFTNFLSPVLPYDLPGVGRHIELDLSSFLVRYFSNRMEVLDVRADNFRPLSQYLQRFFRDHPLVFLSTARDALRYLTRTLAKARRMSRGKKSEAYRDVVERNGQLLRREAERFAGGRHGATEELHGVLKELAARRASPVLSTGVNRYLRMLLNRPARALLWIAPLYLILFIPEAVGGVTNLLGAAFSGWEREAWSVLLFLRIPHATLGVALVVCALAIRQALERHNRRDALQEDPVFLLRRAAFFIAGRLRVPCIVFGHSHVEDVQRLSENRWYFNSGTWTGVYSEQENLYRDVRQFTFVRFRNGHGDLLQWDASRSEPRPVVVVDAAPFRLPERSRWIHTVWNLLRRK
jgi:UDP-2,3-diacylglucosamine pyrophosphatase LpxH